MIFVDGLGIGERDRTRNPIASFPEGRLAVFSSGPLPLEGISLGLDATLGVEGLPQSATGQTALLTGKNAARIIDRHLFGFPNKKLRQVIMEFSLSRRLVDAGLTAAFLNAYRPLFFDLGEAIWNKPLSVTTWNNKAAGLPFFSLRDVIEERAIYNEFTNAALREKGFDLPLFTPAQAGAIVARQSREYDFLLFEYFRTDTAGHAQEMEQAVGEIEKLELFLEAVLAEIDLDETVVLVTSDHGNIEDLSVRTHTMNPALTRLWGRDADEVAASLESIRDVAGAVFEFLT